MFETFESYEFLFEFKLENGKRVSNNEATSRLTASIDLLDTLVSIYQERQENWICNPDI